MGGLIVWVSVVYRLFSSLGRFKNGLLKNIYAPFGKGRAKNPCGTLRLPAVLHAAKAKLSRTDFSRNLVESVLSVVDIRVHAEVAAQVCRNLFFRPICLIV